MRAVIMKIGTMPTRPYFIKETKNIKGCEISKGQKIIFRNQEKNAIWQKGMVDTVKNDVPFVSLL